MMNLFRCVWAVSIGLISLSLSSAYAESSFFVSKLQPPGSFGNHYSLFLSSGEILEVDRFDVVSINKLKKVLGTTDRVVLKVIENGSESGIRSLVTEVEVKYNPINRNKEYFNQDRYERLYIESRDPLANYELTTYRTYEIAQEVMDVFNGKTHDDSQCYARAHMWTYEAFLEYGDNLGKVWIFFSDKYIREYDHKWWFHVAPYARIKNYSMPMVLDRGFTKIPYQLENWKNIFIKNKAECRRIYNYADYPRNTENEYCFLMFSSAYYWQPRDLEALGKSIRNFRWGYVLKDLDWSYNDALGTSGVRAPYSRNRESHNSYRF